MNNLLDYISSFLFGFKRSLRFLLSSFLFFLTLFTVIVAFNKDKLATYESIGGQSRYNWIYPNHIYNFYCSQVKLNVDGKNTHNLSFEEDKNTNKHYYYIDRTGSIDKKFKDITTINSMIDELVDQLKSLDNKINKEDLNKSGDYKSLLTVFSIASASYETNKTIHYSIYNFNGKNVLNKGITSQKENGSIDTITRLETIKHIDGTLGNDSNVQSFTYFSDLFLEVFKDINRKKINGIKPEKYIVTIISDFVSDIEKGKDEKWQLQKLDNSLSKYNTMTKNIEFKLIVLPTNSNKNNTIDASTILLHLKNNLEYAFVYNFDIEKKKSNNDFNEEFKLFNNYPTYIPKKDEILHSYHPLKYNGYKNMVDTKYSYLSLKLLNGTYYIRSSEKLLYGTSIKNIRDTIFKNKLSKINVSNGSNYFFKSLIKTDYPIFLDISRSDKTFFNRYKVMSKRKLSYFTSFSLFFLLGFISNIILLFFSTLIMFAIQKKINQRKELCLMICFAAIIISALLYLGIYPISHNFISLFSDYIIPLILFTVVSILCTLVFLSFFKKDLQKIRQN